VLRVARDPTGAVAGVEVAGRRPGTSRLLRARVVVLCASPVESARILHLSDPGGAGAADGPLGRGLVDHMVAGILVVRDEPPSVVHPGPLAHAAWSQQRPRTRADADGYVLEIRGPTPLSILGEGWLAALGVDQRTSERLTSYSVHSMAAAAPNPRRRVSFDRARLDGLGRPIPFLHLAWSARDRALARRIDIAARNVAEALAGPTGRVIRVHDPLDPGGVGHETGTARMGARADDSVVDAFGEVRGFPRLFLGDASILPTLFDRHPSFTLLAMSLRVAESLVARGRRGEI
jgi:choline dehydrogenase-like flavoprotein